MKRLTFLILAVCLLIGLINFIGCEQEVQKSTDVDAFVNDFFKLNNYYASRIEMETWRRLSGQPNDSLDYFKNKQVAFLSDSQKRDATVRLIRIEKNESLKEKLKHMHRICLLATIEANSDVVRVRDSFISSNFLSSPSGASAEFSQALSRLARTRNQAASRLGYNSYFDLLLYCEGIDRGEYLKFLKMVDDATSPRFKQIVDSVLKVSGESTISFDGTASRKLSQAESTDYLGLIKKTVGGLGYNFEAMPIYLSEGTGNRQDKRTQLFRIDIPNDIRIIVNNSKDGFQLSDLFNHIGQAIYLINIDQRDQFYRQPPSVGFELGMAQMLGRLVGMKDWKRKYAGMPEPMVLSESTGQELSNLYRIRQELVYSRFQFELYNDPFAELEETYGRLYEECIGVPCNSPQGIWQDNSDFIMRPLHNYDVLVGEVVAAQIYYYIDSKYGSVLDNPRTREFLVQNMYRHGARDSWKVLLERGTGQEISAEFLLSAFRD